MHINKHYCKNARISQETSYGGLSKNTTRHTSVGVSSDLVLAVNTA